MSYDASEQGLVNEVFKALLASATGDGGKKRAAGLKPPWWRDPAHEAAIFSHLNKWKHGERVDPDSGAHTLVHLAWRALAIAYQETYGKVDPAPDYMRRLLGIPEAEDARDFDLQASSPLLDVGNGPKPIHGPSTPGHPDYLGDIFVGSRTGG